MLPFSLLLILQPLFADWQALNADTGQAGAWVMFYRYGSIGVLGLWITCLLMPRKIVKRLPDIVSFVLMGCVIWEAIVALKQLYGNGISNHALYSFTGTFLNPGPFCGFIAMGVPLAIHYLVKSDKLQATSDECHPAGKLIARSLSFIAFTTLVLSLLLLPAGMSRTAWIATAIGANTVYGMHHKRKCIIWCKQLLSNRKRLIVVGVIFGTLLLVGWKVFYLKEESANGRLMMWKIAYHAITEKPWTGYGAEGFPMAYAEIQERYFANGQGTDMEIYVAGTPDNAFNEYLTITVKYGLIGLGVMLLIGIAAFACALHQRAYGIAGALVTVAVFAFASYPFQLPDFLSTVILLVAVPFCHLLMLGLHDLQKNKVMTTSHEETPISYEVVAIVFVVLTISIIVKGIEQTRVWQARHEAAKEWRNARSLYLMEAYSVVCEDYAPLYEQMKWNHNYLFEYGRALHQMKRYEESNQVLREAEQICGDPMILNIQGKNHEALGEFDQAALLYRRAYHRLPSRLYPLYLEMEMYASPACNRPEAAQEIARKILDTKEKIPSKAVEEMKERAFKLVENDCK